MKIKFMLYIGLAIFSFLFYYSLHFYVCPQSTTDSAFYKVLTDQLDDGKGFKIPFICHHLRSYEMIEHPIDYWMPLGSVYYYVSRRIFGKENEIIINILIWSLLSLIVFYEVLKITKSSYCAITASFIYIFCGRNLYFCLITDNNVLYAVLGYFFFKIASSVEVNVMALAFISSLMVLDRIEGAIFALLAAVSIFMRYRSIRKLIFFCLLLGVFISPWLVRNKLVLDTWWPSNINNLFMTRCADMIDDSYNGNYINYFNMGWQWIILNKLKGLAISIVSLLAIPNLFIYYPFLVMGIISLWKTIGKKYLTYLIIFISLCGFIFTIQTINGTAYHISFAFFPHTVILIACGLSYLFKNKKVKLISQAIILSLVVFWACFYTKISFPTQVKLYDEINSPCKEILKDCKFSSDALIASFYPVYVYTRCGRGGVIMPPGITCQRQIKLAKKYKCNYILTDNRMTDNIDFADAEWKQVEKYDENNFNKAKNDKKYKTVLILYKGR